MNKICTSIEQSKKLIELGLDVNTADMFWDLLDGDEPDEKIPNCCWDRFDITINEFIPAWSLSALLELMPSKVNRIYKLHFIKDNITNGYYYSYKERRSKRIKAVFASHNPIDAAFEMVCWAINNGHLKGK